MFDDDEVGSEAEDTSTVEDEEVESDQSEVSDEVSGEADEANEDEDQEEGDQAETDEDEGEEVATTVKVEYDGEEYEVPAKIKDALMRDQDYTHKTQALAETRKTFEAAQHDFRQYEEATRAHSSQMAQLAAIDQQLESFSKYDWNAAYDADITAATKLRHQAEQLGQHRSQLVNGIERAESERQRLQNENMARTAERTDKQLAKDIPGWGDELKQELGKFAVETLKFRAEAVSRAVSEEEILALYYAQVGFKTLNKVKANEAKAKVPQKAITPSKNIKPKRQSAPTDLSKISDPEAYRKAYMARKRKTG